MMKKRNLFIKIILILIVLTIICIIIPKVSMSFSFNPNDYSPNSTTEVSNADFLKDIGNNIVGPISVVASIISVGVLIVLGIKYMIGSAEERAEYKKTMLTYIIGAFMVFGITTILNIIIEIADIF